MILRLFDWACQGAWIALFVWAAVFKLVRSRQRAAVRRVLVAIDDVDAIVANWDSNEVFVIVNENSIALTGLIIDAERSVLARMPGVLFTVRANPSRRPLTEIAEGELLFSRLVDGMEIP